MKGIPKDAEEAIIVAKKNQTAERIINASDWTGFTIMEPQAIIENRPIPYISDFS